MRGRANSTVVDRESNGLRLGSKMTTYTVEDQRSSGLQRNPEAENSKKTWNKRPKTCFMQENSRQMTRQSSQDSIYCKQNRDINDCKRKV